MKPYFSSSKLDSSPVCCILDPCHMIKLVRNTLADLKVLKNESGQEIKWQFIEDLHHTQSKEGLHAANKLRRAHIEWRSQKMKVALASQTLSRSVADAIKFCRTELCLPQFQGSEATEEFIRLCFLKMPPFIIFLFPSIYIMIIFGWFQETVNQPDGTY